MPLIDGKYELLGEHAGAPGQTVMSAAAPDGSAVNLVWFDLEPHEETLFEQYRRALRRIKREGRAALYDVVSRPGAHYVVWQVDAEARPARPDRELEELLEQFGYEPEHADVRKLDGLPVLFGLAFDGTAIEPILPVSRRVQHANRASGPGWHGSRSGSSGPVSPSCSSPEQRYSWLPASRCAATAASSPSRKYWARTSTRPRQRCTVWAWRCSRCRWRRPRRSAR